MSKRNEPRGSWNHGHEPDRYSPCRKCFEMWADKQRVCRNCGSPSHTFCNR